MTRTTYHVTCNRCDLSLPIEATEDDPIQLVRITCCQCRHIVEVTWPLTRYVIPCPECGAETRIKKIDSTG